MKLKQLTVLPALTAAAASMIFTIGCGNPSSRQFTTDSLSYADSLTLGYSRAYCSMDVAYAADGNSALVDSVNRWIAMQLAMSPIVTTDSVKTPDYTGITDGPELLLTAGKDLMKRSKADFEEYARDSFAVNYEFDWNIRPVCDSTRFVTYASSTYTYLGGAHGSSGYTPATFDKTDGHIYGWDMINPDSVPALRRLIAQYLLTDFFKVPSYADIRDGLFVDPDTMPLPATPPGFVKNGVDFTYMQYEIAPYATGMPDCVIPYPVIRPMLTPRASALLDK